MERVTNGSSIGYEYSTPSWGDDAEGISGSGQSFWFSGGSGAGSGSVLLDDGVGGPLTSVVGAGAVGGVGVSVRGAAAGGLLDGGVDASLAMIDPDGILLFGLATSTNSGIGAAVGSVVPTLFFNSSVSSVTDVPAYIRIASTCIMSVILLVGITGNVLVPIVIAHSKDLRNSTNVFLVNLALADLLVILICLPTGFVELHTTPDVWYLGESMCKLHQHAIFLLTTTNTCF